MLPRETFFSIRESKLLLNWPVSRKLDIIPIM